MIQIGAAYINGIGGKVWIAGETRNYPQWVWSVQGDWYRKSDGRYITSKGIYEKGNLVGCEHYAMEKESWRDLKEKIADSWKDL